MLHSSDFFCTEKMIDLVERITISVVHIVQSYPRHMGFNEPIYSVTSEDDPLAVQNHSEQNKICSVFLCL